jgi:hypothetical protein
MKTDVYFYYLDGCEKCTKIKYELIKAEIEHELVNCTSSSNSLCDKLEDQIDCGRYPMVVIKKKGSNTVIHFCDKKAVLEGKSKRIPVDSEEMFVKEVKKAYF